MSSRPQHQSVTIVNHPTSHTNDEYEADWRYQSLPTEASPEDHLGWAGGSSPVRNNSTTGEEIDRVLQSDPFLPF